MTRVRRTGNARASAAEHRAVRTLARRLAAEIDPHGRSSVLLTGSWARGDAHRWSDVDLWVIADRARGYHRMIERDGHFVSVKFLTPSVARREWRDPRRFDGAVPGWRTARILRDPGGIARTLKREASAFRWADVRRVRDRFLAEQITECAEEVAKLLRARAVGERETASVQRNLLADRMAPLPALGPEQLHPTENGLPCR
jgi:predicted nucleotidyltransferase